MLEVTFPISKRNGIQGKFIESMVKIFPECAISGLGKQIFICSGNNPDIDFDFFIASDFSDFSLLDSP